MYMHINATIYATALEAIFDPPFVCEFQSRAAAHATAFYDL